MADEPLLPVSDAIRAILAAAPAPRAETVLLARAAGRVLREAVRADADAPPFDRSMMDGYAVRAADVAKAPAELRVVAVVPAGVVPDRPVGPGEAAKVMTGAPVPEGADAVAIVERTKELGEGRVRVLEPVPAGGNVSPRGAILKAGETVLDAGVPIGPDEVGVLASAGRVDVPVHAAPRVAVASTGDEVVPPGETPGPGRIRNSNSPSLMARVVRDGGVAEDLGIVPDDLGATRDAVRRAVVDRDVVLFTGGVSMGDRDLVGAALDAEGFRRVFHKVRLKPGKPVLFGTLGDVLVFGLPGNPVSVTVTYELLVRPLLRKLGGATPYHRPRVTARLTGESPAAIPREQYLPARLELGTGGFCVRRLPWSGSADLWGAARRNALLVVPAGGPAPAQDGPAEVLVTQEELSGLLAGSCDE